MGSATVTATAVARPVWPYRVLAAQNAYWAGGDHDKYIMALEEALNVSLGSHDRAERLSSAALEVISQGGNGEGWTLNDAVTLLRLAVGPLNERGFEPLTVEDLDRAVAITGGPL